MKYLLDLFSSPYPPTFTRGKARRPARARHCPHSSIMSFLYDTGKRLVKVAEEEHCPVGLAHFQVVGG